MIKISDVLKPTGVPVMKLKYSGKATTYITYFLYNEQGEAFAENKEIATSYFIQVDIFTMDDFTDLYNQVLSLMTQSGMYRNYTHELYENDTQLKHKIVRFQYTEEHS
jgi:hypothetical protein